MFQGACKQGRLIAFAAILAATAAPAIGQDRTDPRPVDVETAAHRLADEILDTRTTQQSPPFTSDAEHARTIDPVLTKGTAVWIHEELPSPPLTVLGGRVFSYSDVTYDPLDAPVLTIRPIDDDQVVPFLIRVVIAPQSEISENAAVHVSFSPPPIFDPHFGQVEAWVDSKATEVTIKRSLKKARLDLRVPLARREGKAAQGLEESISVIVAGELILGAYKPVSVNRFSNNVGDPPLGPPLAGLAALEIGRDIDTTDERERLENLAENLSSSSATAYDRVVAANSWVSDHLQYREGPASRSAIEALEDRSGDCDEHTTLLVALLRAMEIPARRATGLLYNFVALAPHAWAEVGLPKRDGAVHWFIVDPTFSGTSKLEKDKAAYVQFKDRVFLYPMKPSIYFQEMTARRTVDILLNWREPAARNLDSPSEAGRFVDLVISSVDREISAGAQRLADAGLLFRRQSASIVGSPYVIVERPLDGGHSNDMQLRLENEERLVLDLTAGDGSEVDDEVIKSVRAVYRDLSNSFFASKPAYRNLELVYIRDRYSDRLHTVSLRFERYLVEHQLARILKRLSKNGFLTEEETARISAVAKASGGKNLYLLQELARQLPAGE
jgi:transglutaminase-like putative cysteine protease